MESARPFRTQAARTPIQGDRIGEALVVLLVLLCIMWPAELPIVMFLHGVVRPVVGEAYLLVAHGALLTFVSLAALAVRGARLPHGSGDWRWWAASCVGYLTVGIAPLAVSAITGVDTQITYQEFVFGYIAPVAFIAAALSLSARDQQRLWTAFYLGWVAFLAGSVVMLGIAWRAANDSLPGFASAPFAQQVIMWRFTLGEPWNLYGVTMGNANKLSNNLVMFLLMSRSLLTLEGPSRGRRRILLCFWALAVVTLIVMFSRAAMLLLPLVIAASGVIGELSGASRRLVLVTACCSIAAVAVTAPEIFDYLFAAKYLPQADADPLGTLGDRFAQWSQLLDFFSEHAKESIIGLGTSGYGMRFFNSPEPGTHNTFLDLWTQAGIFSPLILLGTIASIGLQVFVGAKSVRRKTVVAAGLFAIVLLMTREHSFSYLYVTSLGGLCFVVLIYACVAPDPEAMAGRYGPSAIGGCEESL